MRSGGVLVGPLAEFMGGQMVALFVCCCGGGMGVGGKTVKLGGAGLWALRH